MAKIGGLASFVNKETKMRGSAPGEKESIVYLPIDKLIPNEENFYGLRDVESLAGLISLSRHVEPLTVIPREDGLYTILSGHRRRAAVEMLIEKEGFPSELPCIITKPEPIVIEQEDGTNITFDEKQVQLFQLIASNRGQRDQRTLEEKRQEIRILEPFARAIYAQKRAEGYKGVYRSFFAEEILSMSATQLQRMQSIDRLSETVRKAVDEGIISETSAWELATMPQEEQDSIIEAIRSGELDRTTKAVREERKRREEGASDEEHGSAFSDQQEGSAYGVEDAAPPPFTPYDEEAEDEAERAHSEPETAEREDDKQEETKQWSAPQRKQNQSDGIEHSHPSRSFTEVIRSELPAAPKEQPDDPQAEAQNWFKQSQLIAYQSILDEAKRMKEELLVSEPVQSAQWGIREAVALFRLQELKADMED